MAPPTNYLAVLKAAYDYTPDSEDEIAIKEDQILFLIERTDDEYVLRPTPAFPHLLNWFICFLLAGGRLSQRMRMSRMKAASYPLRMSSK